MNEFQQYFQHLKPQLLQEIKRQCNDISKISLPNSNDIAEKIYEYTSRGKLLRGVLVCLAAESSGRIVDSTVLSVAGAIELAQTALLIHDDIMDSDDLRRGKPSMHEIYKDIVQDIRKSEALAMCVGDIVLFHLFRYLKDSPDLVLLFSNELTKTALGQHLDIYYSCENTELSEDDIFTVIKNKTSYYTFYIPLSAGMILGSIPEQEREDIKKFSSLAGLIFQIKDDDLNYAQEQQVGKTSGGDITENKKTLCRLELIKRYPEIKDKFGDPEKICEIQQLYINSGTKEYINRLLIKYAEESKQLISQLNIKDEYRYLWYMLVDYLLNRTF